MSDRIEVRGLRATVIVGMNPEERDRPQPIELDLDLHLDLTAAGMSDDLADTVHYGEAAEAALRAVSECHALLLERVAHLAARAVLDHDDRIDAITVTVRKLRPPVPFDLTTTGVTITRHRS
jgi:dihydroneopterin aldolase